MNNPAEVFSDGPVIHRRTDVTFPPPAHEGIGWGLFIAQIVTVAVIYLIGSVLPLIPLIVAQVMAGDASEPVLSSPEVLSTVVLSMALGLAVAWAWLAREKRVDEAWTLTLPDSWVRTGLWALGTTIAIFAIFTFGGALVEQLGLGAPDATELLAYVTESPLMFWLWIIGVAVLAAGVGEELLYRGFLMDRLSRVAGLRGRVWLVIIIQAALFGLPHAYQGWGGVVVTGSVGLLLGWVRLKNGGNLWACILAHIAVDVIAMTAAYGETLGWFGG